MDSVRSGGEGRGLAALLHPLLLFLHFVQESHTQSFAHSAPTRRRISLHPQEGAAGPVSYISSIYAFHVHGPHNYPLGG